MIEVDRQTQASINLQTFLENVEEFNSEKIFSRDVGQYPVLSHDQMLMAYRLWDDRKRPEAALNPEIAKEEQRKTVEILRQNPEFINSIPSQEQERFKNLFSVSENMRDFVFYGNLRLLLLIAHERKGLSYMDRVQEGSIGLKIAVERFDYTKGFKFSTLASLAIKQKIQLAMHRNIGELTGLPRKVYVASGEARRLREELYKQGVVEVSAKDIVPKLMQLGYKEDEAEVAFLLLGGFYETSLETPLNKSEHGATIGDLIPDTSFNTEREAMAAAESEEVLSALESLNPKQARVIIKSFGLYGETVHKLSEVAEEMGVSKQAAWQLQKAALEKLRIILTKRVPQQNEEIIWQDPEEFTDTISKLPTEKYIQLVIGFVCHFTGRSLEEIEGNSRDSRLVEDRGIISSLIHLHPDVILKNIGRALGGRDHSTIINQLEKIMEKRKSNPKFEGFFNKLKKELHLEAKQLVKNLDSVQREA